jgi:hypothetical protein
MKNYKSLIAFIFLLVFCSPAFSQILNGQNISEDKLHDHVFFLASDSLKGRGINTPELDHAANYIKDNLQLKNVSSPNPEYFQFFTLSSSGVVKEKSFIKVLNKRGKEKKSLKHFITFNQNTDVADIEGDLLFAGFGPGKLFGDENGTENSDYNGKIVLYSAGTPESFIEGNSQRLDNALERRKMEEIKNAGAKALILVTSIHDTANTTYRQILLMTSRQKFSIGAASTNKLPDVFIINPETANELTGKKKNWGKLLKTASENKEQNYHSLINNRVHIRSVLTEKKVEARNVIGIIEGSDSVLKDECIVFIAHYDHLGTNEKGEMYNGADDNASGVAILLEVAGMFSLLPIKPKRSMVFLFPTAEEIGLFGSDYYSQNPVYPIEKTIACINLDMVGRVFEERDSVWNHSPKLVKDYDGIYALVNDFNPTLKTLTEQACSQLELKPDFSLPGQFFYTSDHYHFHKHQVPVLNLSTGYTADYHKPTDTADRIRTDKMKRIAQLCYLLGMELANGENVK